MSTTPQPLISTLADLTAAKLVQFVTSNAPPRPNTDVPEFPGAGASSDAYIKALNYRQAVSEVFGSAPNEPDPIIGDNQKAIDQFSGEAHEWEQHKDTLPIPAWPTLKDIDNAGDATSFNAWWARYSERFDATSPFFGDDAYTGFLAQKQYFKKTVAPLPLVTILPPQAAPAGPPLNTSNPIGPKAPGAPWWTNLGGAAFSVGDTDPSGKYRLINPSPMISDPSKFVWVRA